MIGESPEVNEPAIEPTRLDCRVLVVDNLPSQRFLLTWLLQGAGAEVETAANGQAVVLAVQAAELECRPFDLVLINLKLPVMDGYATLAAIRQLGHNVPVVAMSTDNRDHTIRRCREAGFDAFVDKFRVEERLVLTVRQLVGLNHSANGCV